jgi:hypothetical protein
MGQTVSAEAWNDCGLRHQFLRITAEAIGDANQMGLYFRRSETVSSRLICEGETHEV